MALLPSNGHDCHDCSSVSPSTSSILQPQSIATSLSQLAIDPGKKATGSKSLSNSDIPTSPNQLQGVVVESLKTPIHSKLNLPSEEGANTNGAIAFGGGILFEPEHSKSAAGEDGGVAWMLYRQRSRSAGKIPSTTNSNDAAGPSGSRHTKTLSGQSDIKSSANRQAVLFNKLTVLVKGSSAHSSTSLDMEHQHHSKHPHHHSSTFKKRLSSGNDNPSSTLAISTSSLGTAAKATHELDGAQSMHFFNQQHHTMMSASSPASTVSDISYLAPLSSTTTNASTYSSESHSSTCTTCSYPSTSSYPTSVYTTSSAASTLCHHYHPYPGDAPQLKERSRRIGMRKFTSWTPDQSSGEISPTATLADTRSTLKTDLFSPTTLSSTTGLRGANSAFFQPRDGPTLKELSSRKTRYYDKRDIPTAPPGGATPSGRGRKGPKKVDAKALFSNERTYMHWIKFGLLLGTLALNLISFGQSAGQQVGMFLVLVAMSTLVYATTIFHLRHGWMAKLRQDVLYYDRIGPSVLFAALFFAYATNVALTMHKMVGDITDESNQVYFNMDKGPLDI